MQVVSTPSAMQRWSAAEKRVPHSLGFVPTMGALHEGHTRLLDVARSENDSTVLSIFVNPLQFNVKDDFDRYPRTVEDDLELARRHGVDCVFLPSAADMYPPDATVRVAPGSAAEGMEGEMRPGHFEGVTTIVAKLFNCVLPDRAYFGKKDYQQLAVVRQMVTDLDFSVGIVGVDTVRENDGLALSSRNTRLTQAHRAEASVLYRGLTVAADGHSRGITDTDALRRAVVEVVDTVPQARLEYVAIVDQVTLQPVTTTRDGAVVCIAAWFGDVRLIDNIELSAR